MKLTWTLVIGLLLLAGCADSEEQREARIAAALDKLPEKDRAAAKAQKFCAVKEKSRLGSMGEPIKVTVQGQDVFLCCKGCSKKALADPAKTLATVKSLKSPGDGAAAE